jgi:hypothetical protein
MCDTLHTVLPSQIRSMHLLGTHRLIRKLYVGQERNSAVSDCLCAARAAIHCPGLTARKMRHINDFSSVRLSEGSFMSYSPRIPKVRWVLEGFQASPVCPSGKSNMKMICRIGGMILTGKSEVPGGKNLSQCHFVHQKSHEVTWDRTQTSKD